MRKRATRRTAAVGLDREPILDGIRGLAILLVLFHHLVQSSGIDQGVWFDLQVYRLAYSSWLGVDLFFVLSGFLITGILYDAKGSEGYFRVFYGRRMLRIFPLYFGFLLLAVVFFPLWLPAESGAALAHNQGWYWLYLSNFHVALEGWQDPIHLGHFWSLAVEEQFYLLWPMAVWSLGRPKLLAVAAGCFFGALVLRIIEPFGISPLATYVLLPTRMDSLAAGAFLALLIRDRDGARGLGNWPWITLVGSLAVIVALFLTVRKLNHYEPTVRTLGYTAIALAFASLIAVALSAPAQGWLRRLLASLPLTWLGRYSYGLYVFHVPIILFFKDSGFQAEQFPRLWGSSLPGVGVFCAIGALLSIACAVASFHLWETPFLRLKRYFRYEDRQTDLNGGLRDASVGTPTR